VYLPVEEGGRELLRVEVLDVKPNGEAKFRLWYYKWRETRPDQPYVDFEIRPYRYRGSTFHFIGFIYANKAKGILRDHLAEIAELLKREGIKGVSLITYGKQLQFTGAFRDSVLARLGVELELPHAEPAMVEYLGGLKFKVGDREVEFGGRYVKGPYEFYAELRLASAEEAVCYAASLKALGVEAKAVGDTVRLDSDAFFGLLAATGAAPPGLTPLYRSNDLQVYAKVEGGRMRFYFAVRHEGIWRAVDGLYGEWYVLLVRAEREVLEAIRGAVAKALEKLAPEQQGRQTKVGVLSEIRDEKGNVKVHYLHLYGHHLASFLKHAAEEVRAEPSEVRLEGRNIVVEAGGVKAEVVFKLLKFGKAEFLLAQDVAQMLTLHKSLKAAGVPVEITPRGIRVDGEAMWALVAVAVERSVPDKLPAEVMPGVELLKVYNIGGMRVYAFRAEGAHYYFALKTKEGWRAAGGKYDGKMVLIYGEVARAVADAINATYSEMGAERRVEVKYNKDGVVYIQLTNVDLELLGLR